MGGSWGGGGGGQFHLASQANSVSKKEMSGWMWMSP